MSNRRARSLPLLGLLGVALVLVLMLIGAFLVGGLVGKLGVTPLVKPINVSETFIRNTLGRIRGHEQNQNYLESALLELKMTELAAMPDNSGDNVAFTPVGDGYIVATRGGELHYVELNWPDSVRREQMALMVPTEKDRFLREPIIEKNARLPLQFGVKGVFAEQQGDQLSLFASYHFWKQDQQCAVMRFARADLDLGQLVTSENSEWQVLFESSPCLQLDSRHNRTGGDGTFLQAGGQIISFDEHRLLVTVGDHFMDGIHNTDLVQAADASYGKTWLLDKRTGQAEMYSMGHRNAQGLTQDQYGNIWSTEHGPRGGDELNLVQQGENYGWPLASYGTLYAGYMYPEGKHWLTHAGFAQAQYYWAPSIAPSNLIRLNNSRFKRWGDALILASLGGRSLFHIQLDDTRVVGVERIEVGDRLRDLVQTTSGNVLVMSDGGTFYKLEPADASQESNDPATARAARGRALWMTCAACHHSAPEDGHHIGPNLHGVVNRPVGALSDFEYSPAMRAAGGVWTRQRLHRFLANPDSEVPGTSMTAGAITDEVNRQTLIEYLEKLSAN